MTDTDQLTVEKIHQMSAGRKMDALIWFRVMHPEADPTRCAELSGLGWVAPYYSTEIAAAWKVLEKVQEIGSLQNFGGFGWRCEIHTASPGGRDCAGEADTAPLAICRAALLSVMKG